jgi:hypothetical protein
MTGAWGPLWRGGSAEWPSGSPGCRTAQRGALGRYNWPTVAEAEKPATAVPGGLGREGCA